MKVAEVLGVVLLGAGAVVGVVVVFGLGRSSDTRAYAQMLAKLPTRYAPAGRYVGPLENNLDPPEVILARDRIPVVR